MKAKKERYIRDGKQYDELFPKANLTDKTVKRSATVTDTVRFIPRVVELTKWQTEKISEKLKGKNEYETCRNIWDFLYAYVNYNKDEAGREQIRSPARLWHDRLRGVDCDCYTVTICTMLLNCGIEKKKILLRITKYGQEHFQHIYPIVRMDSNSGGNKYVTIDCVTDEFDYEEPYSEKKDINMDLEYLDGFSSEPSLFGDDEMGKLFKKKTTSAKDPTKGGKSFIVKGLNVVNKANPATVALRNGVLASMKLNLFKVAQRLKWSYLSPEEAKKRGIDMAKWNQLVHVKERLEKIFYGAGGNPANLKKAILTGKGNPNKEVAGLFGVMSEGTVFEMNEQTPIPQLIGDEIYFSENVEGMENDQLGEPVTAATIGAASGVMAAISGLLKQIGNIFPGKGKGSGDFENTAADDESAIEQGKNLPASSDSGEDEQPDGEENDASSEKALTRKSADKKSGKPKETFWEKNKKWLKPTLWGAGGLSVLVGGFKLLTGKKNKGQTKQALAGLQSKKKSSPAEKKKSISII